MKLPNGTMPSKLRKSIQKLKIVVSGYLPGIQQRSPLILKLNKSEEGIYRRMKQVISLFSKL